MADFDLNGGLSAAEFESLRELSKGLGWHTLPARHTAKLLSLGYARDAVGGLVITDIGQLRAARGS